MISYFKAVRTVISNLRKERADVAEKARIAKAFNDRYAYRHQFVNGKERLEGTAMYGVTPPGGFAWMCPECNKIHHPTACSVFSGLQYPACCGHPHGDRLYSNIRTR